MINNIIEKSKIPIIWIDTSFVSKIAASKLNILKNPDEELRYIRLYKVLFNKAREEKLLCPQGDQEEEIQEFVPVGCDYKEFLLKCHDIIVSLSLGSCLIHRKTIESFQRHYFMTAYFNNSTDIKLNCSNIMSKKSIMDFLGKKLIISVPPGGIIEEIDQKRINRKKYCDEMERDRIINVQSGVDYATQLQKEYAGIIEYIVQSIDEYMKNGDVLKIYHLAEMLGEWGHVSKKYGDPEGLLNFLRSEHYKTLPSVEIQCKLFAKLLTGSQQIESGDMMDISQLSAVIPYCNFLLTDRKMKNRICELEFDKQFNLEVFCMRDYEKLISQLESL